MARPKKNPDYDPERIMNNLLQAVSTCYLFGKEMGAAVSLRHVAEEFGFTHLKVRKLLITAGVYHAEQADQINEYKKQGKSVQEIMLLTGLKQAAVHSYLPYTKMVYNADELSLNAERIRCYRERQAAVKQIEEYFQTGDGNLQDLTWDALVCFAGYPFYTSRGLKYTYEIRGQEMFVSRKEKSITRASVDLALQNVLQMNREVRGPKKLNVFGASYIFPIFILNFQ